MAVDLNDFDSVISEIFFRLSRLESGEILSNAAIDRGALTVKSAEGLRVGTPDDPTGSAFVYGVLRIIGQLLLQGDMAVTGDGKITVGGVVIEPVGGGRIRVGTGSSAIVIDSASRTITLGSNITLDAAAQKITVGSGSNAIVIDASAKSITIPGPSGATVLANGDITFGTGSVLRSDASTSGAQLITGNWRLMVGQNGFALHRTSGNGASITGAGNQLNIGADTVTINELVKMPGLTPLPSGEAFDTVVRSRVTGMLHMFAGGTGGGPGDGVFAWPFSLDLVTSEYGMRQNPVTGQYTLHEGIDFGSGIANIQGTPIPSAGSGTVETAGVYGGYGNAVIINHGIDPTYLGGGHEIKTLYGHMYQTPAVSVGQAIALGQTLGGIGQTGQSAGNHLHFEVWVDGVKVNPRTFMAAHGG